MTDLKDRSLGAFLGLAIGDALGAPVEFETRGKFDPVTSYRSGGPFNLPAGYWTDDTSMALCLADSLIANKGKNDPADQMRRYTNWYKSGENSSTGVCFDIGNGTRLAIEHYLGGELKVYPHSSEGNGSIMRVAPLAIVYASLPDKGLREEVLRSSMTTHNEYASDLTSEFAVLLKRAINGDDKTRLHTSAVDYSSSDRINNNGHTPDTLRSALYHFHTTLSFEEAVLQAVNYGSDADTVGAVTGQLAGAFYGLKAIPEHLLAGLYNSSEILQIATNLFDLRTSQ